jgi:hypothetical protein
MGIFGNGNWKQAKDWAMAQLQGVNINDPNAVKQILSKNGGNNQQIEKALVWGKRMAKGAKILGLNPLKSIGMDLNKVDIDSVENGAREFLGLNNNQSQPQYPSYDRRSVQYQSQTQSLYRSRASELPD